MGAKNTMRRDADDERPVAARRRVRIRVVRVFISTPREFHRIGRRVRCYKNPRETTGTRAAKSNQSTTMTSPTSSERRAAARLARSSAARLEFGRS